MNKNLYNYTTPKSGNEETGFFNIKGRITRKAFFLRYLLTICLYALSYVFYITGIYGDCESRTFIFFETIHIYILPVMLCIFVLIQGAKRMHDVNKTGLYFLIPFYNVYLTFLPGTKGNNNYGIDPIPIKNIQFFDELDADSTDDIIEGNSVKQGKNNLDKWRTHLIQVRNANPDKKYKEVLEIARKTYEKPLKTKEMNHKTNKALNSNTKGKFRNTATYLFFSVIIIFLIIGECNSNHAPIEIASEPAPMDSTKYPADEKKKQKKSMKKTKKENNTEGGYYEPSNSNSKSNTGYEDYRTDEVEGEDTDTIDPNNTDF
jgi:uncharacterized membrane protein YhaH (DUF805 family)